MIAVLITVGFMVAVCLYFGLDWGTTGGIIALSWLFGLTVFRVITDAIREEGQE